MSCLSGRSHAVVALLTCGAAVGCAHAQEGNTEKLKLRAAVTQAQDNNFQRAIDTKAVADQINTQTLDVIVALPYGQQRLELEANLAANKHQTFTQFDYTGHNYNAAWRWSLTPSLVGVLSSKRTETLNSVADSVDPTLRNTNVTKIDNLNAGYLLGGPWQLFADYSKGTSTNERALLGINDINFQSHTVGVSYAPSAGNSLNYALRSDTGNSNSTSNNTSANTSISSGEYRYTGHAFVATYAPTVNTSLKGRLAYIEQRFAIAPKFDFSGITGGLEGTWRVTPKTSINTSWLRDITSFQTVDSTHASTDVFSFAPKWQVRPTLSVGWTYKQSVRDGLGSPNGTASTRRDHMQETMWDINWQPRKYVILRAAYANANRTSSVVDQDYTAQVVTLGAQFIY